uniref:Uncharacterized protein n=1 Tax=Timema tahoe TaxID=61484 RepID=A0A7R9IBA8_9NEOP|nr:unnamed protein product [Timema tahoe]
MLTEGPSLDMKSSSNHLPPSDLNATKELTPLKDDGGDSGATVVVEKVITYAVVPPDGGWGWVIVTASFFCNLIVDGIIFTFGMFLNDIQREFGGSKSKVAVVGSLLAGFYLMAGTYVSKDAANYSALIDPFLSARNGPFVSALANRYGFRLVTILGSILGTVGFLASSFATDVEFLFVSYGIIGGIGFGLIYVPAVITTGFYFERWRAIATGIAVCGSGIGTFVLAPFAVHLIEWYGWRGALIIQAGLVLNCAIFGTLFRPLEPVRVVTTREVSMKNNHSASKLSLLKRIKQERDEHRRNRGSLASVDSDKYEKSSIRFALLSRAEYLGQSRSRDELNFIRTAHTNEEEILVTNNNAYTTAAEALARSVGSLPGSRFASTHSLGMSNHHGVETGEEHLKAVYEMERDDNDTMTALVHHQSQTVIRRGSKRLRTASESSSRSRKGLELSGTKPFYRDDIFFGASLTRLPQYTSQSSISYHMSVTRLPTKQDIKEQAGENSRMCTEALTRTLGTMLDFSLFKSPTFLILAVSGFITMMGFYVPFMYLTVLTIGRKEEAEKGAHFLCFTTYHHLTDGYSGASFRNLSSWESLPGWSSVSLAFTANARRNACSCEAASVGVVVTCRLAQALSIDAAVDIPWGRPVEGPATPADVVCEG